MNPAGRLRARFQTRETVGEKFPTGEMTPGAMALALGFLTSKNVSGMRAGEGIMRRDAPTSEPGGNARPCMATGHAIVNSSLADMSRNRPAGHAMPIGLTSESRAVGAQAGNRGLSLITRLLRAIKVRRDDVRGNREFAPFFLPITL